jgi:hypothetical protein
MSVYVQISFAGCHSISEKSVVELVSRCMQLEKFDVTATNVGVLPVELESAANRHFTLNGCPMVSPPVTVHPLDASQFIVQSRSYFAGE